MENDCPLSLSEQNFTVPSITHPRTVQNNNKKGLGYVNNSHRLQYSSLSDDCLSSSTTSKTTYNSFSSSLTVLHGEYLTDPTTISKTKSLSAFSNNAKSNVQISNYGDDRRLEKTNYQDHFSPPGDPYQGEKTRGKIDETAFTRSVRHPFERSVHGYGDTAQLQTSESKYPTPVQASFAISSLPPLSSSSGPRLVTKNTRGHGKGGTKAPNSNGNLTAIPTRNSIDSRAGLEADGAAAQWGGIGNDNGISPYVITRSSSRTFDPLQYTLSSQKIGNQLQPRVHGNFDLETGLRLDV